jgi:hypothetical protein
MTTGSRSSRARRTCTRKTSIWTSRGNHSTSPGRFHRRPSSPASRRLGADDVGGAVWAVEWCAWWGWTPIATNLEPDRFDMGSLRRLFFVPGGQDGHRRSTQRRARGRSRIRGRRRRPRPPKWRWLSITASPPLPAGRLPFLEPEERGFESASVASASARRRRRARSSFMQALEVA